MDRSFLSQPSVIAASRQFICIRTATYESEEEAVFLRAFNTGRGGALENTVFCLLAPDGVTKLSRASRGARQVFSDAGAMADSMNSIAKQYSAKANPAPLPVVANVRLAVDIAAADNQPLVVVRSADDNERKDIEGRLAKLGWSDEFIGRFIYASAAAIDSSVEIEGAQSSSKLLIIQADNFGQKGRALRQSEQTDELSIQALLRDGQRAFGVGVPKQASHMRDGQKLGKFWETQIPVTDIEEQRARDRGRPKN